MKEKDFFTQRRNEQLNIWSELKLVEKYGKYCLIPLDIPKLEHSLLVNWFFDNCKSSYKVSADIASDNTGNTNFEAIDILPTNEMNQQDVWTLNIQQDFMTDFKDVYNFIMEYFPFKTLSRIRLWSSTTNIIYHRDHTKFVDFPGAFRIMLYDENPRQTLNIIPSLPDSANNMKNLFSIPRLADTNSFVWNNLRTKHGSIFRPGFRKIVIILDRYELDIERYEDLIIRSINRYENFCMKSFEPITNYVNL